jgi:hypothetical protein
VHDLLWIERVGDGAETSPDSVDEPLRVEGGDIGAAAGADDHEIAI